MNSTRLLLLAIVLSVLTSACGITSGTFSRTGTSSGSSSKNMKAIETGVASWYGPNFHGKLTANGETYDMDGLTAAHRTLPFNSEVIVENLDNGKSLKVRINDRGPFAKDRIIDLSREAATRLGVIEPGTARVRLYLVKGDLDNSRVTDLKVANYTVQLGSYQDRAFAEKKAAEVDGSRVEELRLNGERVFRVYFGTYQDPEHAKQALDKLQADGHDGFVKQIEND